MMKHGIASKTKPSQIAKIHSMTVSTNARTPD